MIGAYIVIQGEFGQGRRYRLLNLVPLTLWASGKKGLLTGLTSPFTVIFEDSFRIVGVAKSTGMNCRNSEVRGLE
jgi:hypothetical protein